MSRYKTTRRAREFTDRNGTRLYVGDRVRGTSPNEGLRGIVVGFIIVRDQKPFVVRCGKRLIYMNREWTERVPRLEAP